MNWGHAVVAILVFFLIGLGVMVFIATKQNVEMVDDNYYDKELKYQGVIDAKNNLNNLKDSILITAAGDQILLKIPIGAAQNITEGNIEFLRPSDKTKDKMVPVKTDSNGVQQLPKAEFIKGAYRMRARWRSNGKEYFDERDVIIK